METSNFSTASSTTDYSGIGFEKTMTLHFEDLKKDQEYVLKHQEKQQQLKQ